MVRGRSRPGSVCLSLFQPLTELGNEPIQPLFSHIRQGVKYLEMCLKLLRHDLRVPVGSLSRFKLSLPQCNVPGVLNCMSPSNIANTSKSLVTYLCRLYPIVTFQHCKHKQIIGNVPLSFVPHSNLQTLQTQGSHRQTANLLSESKT